MGGLELSQLGPSPPNSGQEVNQIRGEIQTFKDFEGTLGVFHVLSPSNFFRQNYTYGYGAGYGAGARAAVAFCPEPEPEPELEP